MFRLILAFSFLVIAGGMIRSQQNDFNSGVPRDLARWRAVHYSSISYVLSVKVGSNAPFMYGTEEIHVSLDDAANPIIVDWRVAPVAQGQDAAKVQDLALNGNNVAARHAADDLII